MDERYNMARFGSSPCLSRPNHYMNRLSWAVAVAVLLGGNWEGNRRYRSAIALAIPQKEKSAAYAPIGV